MKKLWNIARNNSSRLTDPNSLNSPHVIGPLRLFSSVAFFLRTFTYGVLRTRKLVHWRVLSHVRKKTHNWKTALTHIRKTFVFMHVVAHTLNSLWDKLAIWHSTLPYFKTHLSVENECKCRILSLKSNNFEINIETLSFYINTCLREYEEMYGTVIKWMDKNNLYND